MSPGSLPNRVKRLACAAACALVALAAAAQAAPSPEAELAGFPRKPLRFVVPFPPGGATDFVARAIAPAMGESLGQPIVVDNRAGAGGNQAIEIVARAHPDGHTVLLGDVSTSSIGPALFGARLKVAPDRALAGVTLLASSPNLLVAGARLAPQDLRELIEFAKANPGRLAYTAPAGSQAQLELLDFARRAGLDLAYVAPKRDRPLAHALLEGEAGLSLLAASAAIGHVAAGRLRAYATTSQARLPELPEVPTLAESGFPGLGSDHWNGLFVPAVTPRAVVARLFQAAIVSAQRKSVAEELRQRLVRVTLSGSPDAFEAFVREQTQRWQRIVAENRVKAE